jgi:hypothetical protein
VIVLTTPCTTACPVVGKTMASGRTSASPERGLDLDNIDERTPDVTNPSAETANNGLATETAGPMSSLLYAIRGELPCAFHHTYHYFNNYDSDNTSPRVGSGTRPSPRS